MLEAQKLDGIPLAWLWHGFTMLHNAQEVLRTYEPAPTWTRCLSSAYLPRVDCGLRAWKRPVASSQRPSRAPERLVELFSKSIWVDFEDGKPLGLILVGDKSMGESGEDLLYSFSSAGALKAIAKGRF